MENNDSNNKSQQTGGLKLMTVFIAVLALHVVVIGGFTVYHLMSGGSTDSDLATTDKTHKGSTADSTIADSSDKTVTPADVVSIPASAVPTTTNTTPDASASSTTSTTTPPSTPASTTTPASAPAATPAATSAPDANTVASTTPAPAPTTPLTPTVATPTPGLTLATPAFVPAPAPEVANPGPQAPTGPIASTLLPPPEPSATPAPALIPVPQSAPTPSPSFASGPVHMPPAEKSPDVPHVHMKTYTVKITDSYKKIALAHHITVAQLKEANHINGNTLHTGQKLLIPTGKSEVAEKSAPVEKTATSSLAAAPIVSESVAPMTTGLTSTSTTVAATETHHHLYTVVKGDTLTKIAHHFKTTPSAIMAANDITDPTKLSIGKKLRIPSSTETRSARNSTPAATQPSQVQAKTNATTPQLATYRN